MKNGRKFLPLCDVMEDKYVCFVFLFHIKANFKKAVIIRKVTITTHDKYIYLIKLQITIN